MEDVTHKEILDRLVAVEGKVDTLHDETRELVKAFKAVDGAFTVLGWLAKVAKPLLWIAGVCAMFGALYAQIKLTK
jgi:hypothetical protein